MTGDAALGTRHMGQWLDEGYPTCTEENRFDREVWAVAEHPTEYLRHD